MTLSQTPPVPNQGPGTYWIAYGSRVEWADAMDAWIPLAHEELRNTARRYHAVITYQELAERVQEHSGIGTRMLLPTWIGKLLEEVAIIAAARREPPLTSLCVRQDGTIGDGYERAPKHVTDEPGDDLELYAAQHRLLCYQQYADDLPADGGTPALTPAERERRARKAAAQPSRPGSATCTI